MFQNVFLHVFAYDTKRTIEFTLSSILFLENWIQDYISEDFAAPSPIKSNGHPLIELRRKKSYSIMITSPCNEHPLAPKFYIVKLGFTGVYIIFLIFALKHRLWVLVLTCTHNQCFEQKKRKILYFHLKITIFTAM